MLNNTRKCCCTFLVGVLDVVRGQVNKQTVPQKILILLSLSCLHLGVGRFAAGGQAWEGRAQLWSDGHFHDLCYTNLDQDPSPSWPDYFCENLGYSEGSFIIGLVIDIKKCLAGHR